ncbi:MAG: hypothetical protein EPN47_08530 [Acidobacteria bacterium]|nr:MAG: hypothetical protein EPN47_08530 [Acidobacteriota bacterium]
MKNRDAIYDLHERARRLIDRELVEGLEPEERIWLDEHLGACEACAVQWVSTQAALTALKSISVPVPHGLAASTSLCVRENAERLKTRRSRNIALTVGCAVSWAAGVASAPLVWRVCEWVGATLSLPRIVWEAGFFCWWLVPAAAAGLVILWVNSRAEREEMNGRLWTGPQSNGW